MKTTKIGDQPLKKIIVADASGYKIEINMWRIHSNTDLKVGETLLINNVKIGEYRRRMLTTFDETCIKVNPPKSIECVKELYEYMSKTDLKGEFIDLQNIIELKNEKGMEESSTFCTVHMKDILEYLDYNEEIKKYVKVTGTVTLIKHNEKNYYIGCSNKNCKKKLIYDELNLEYKCPGCHKVSKDPTYYYTLLVLVKDASCEHWINIFGKTAETLMKCSAKEYCDILNSNNEEKLKEISEGIEFKEFNFWVKPKTQTYNSIDKKKIYAYKIKPLDEKLDAHQLIQYLKKEVQ